MMIFIYFFLWSMETDTTGRWTCYMAIT